MSLKEDINAGLVAISSPNKPPELVLDNSGCCTILVPLPASVVSLVDGQLIVQVKLSRTGRFFTLLSPIGAIQEKLNREFFKALFYRQFYADQVSGVSIAINAENDTLVAVYHWMLESISPQDFSSLFQGFVTATLDLLGEISNMVEVAQNSI
jgi:hypothetical protein